MRSFLLSLFLVFSLSGCLGSFSTKTPTKEEQSEKTRSELTVLKDVKESYLTGLERANKYNLYVSYYSDYPDLAVTIPFIYGAKLEIDREHYMVRRYSKRVLLFPGYGIKDRFNMTYSEEGDYGRLQELGFNSFESLYLFVLNKLTSYSLNESYAFISELEKSGILKSSEALDFNEVQSRNEKYIKKLFANYLDFEKESFQNTDIDEALKFWFLDINDRLITLNKDEFKPYSMTDFIVKKLLTSQKPILLKYI